MGVGVGVGVHLTFIVCAFARQCWVSANAWLAIRLVFLSSWPTVWNELICFGLKTSLIWQVLKHPWLAGQDRYMSFA
jgi:hypothetical protein